MRVRALAHVLEPDYEARRRRRRWSCYTPTIERGRNISSLCEKETTDSERQSISLDFRGSDPDLTRRRGTHAFFLYESSASLLLFSLSFCNPHIKTVRVRAVVIMMPMIAVLVGHLNHAMSKLQIIDRCRQKQKATK
jgi:hypothetical protein